MNVRTSASLRRTRPADATGRDLGHLPFLIDNSAEDMAKPCTVGPNRHYGSLDAIPKVTDFAAPCVKRHRVESYILALSSPKRKPHLKSSTPERTMYCSNRSTRQTLRVHFIMARMLALRKNSTANGWTSCVRPMDSPSRKKAITKTPDRCLT
ncbi:MAG: hypothetical protein IPH35_18290 [Rhodoferax sp.]|nr:hypothetical protein [Rhodoferax sp.]